ncbi:glycoside hydrolase [Candidatus Parcubacteria bacterium]|nr:glycoside hydrolase [Candidatus Parcubacteria bacterium]
MIDRDRLLTACRKVLDDNRRGDHTIPSGKMYPHQWLWDSCFIAIGLSHYDPERAKTELLSLVEGQWNNGMLPHMIFEPGLRYLPDRWLWNSHVNLNSPKNLTTSGITQPPVLAEAAKQIGDKLSPIERKRWYAQMLPPLIKYHKWLYEEREPNEDGLVTLIHPYETGLDNTPPWTRQLHDHHKPWWLPLYKYLPVDFIIHRFRRDIKRRNKYQRISNLDALLYLDIVWLYRSRNYEIKAILPHDKFLVEDLTYNCILIRANKHLRQMADEAGYNLPEDLLSAAARSESALEALWDHENKEYYSRSFSEGGLIKISSISGLIPLYSGAVSQKRARQLAERLKDNNTFGPDYPVPSVPVNSNWFKQHGYWQGPTWINTNWLIIQGLKDYGLDKEAKALTEKTLKLIEKHGSREYFSPLKGTPAGAKKFSWTAALTIDLLN